MSDVSEESDTSDSSGLSESEDTGADSGGRRLKPRKYQLELAENALMGHNTIICSGTGSGKTIVALHIIKKHLEGVPEGERKVVFMARTCALIKQQAERCKKYLHQYKTQLITSDEDSIKSINFFMEHCDILCFTPQILVNSLDDKLIQNLSVFSLLVLDECHNTRGNEPYAMLMRKYLMEKSNRKNQLPQIVGLTASVGVGKSRTVIEAEEYILRLCALLDVCNLSTVKKNEKGYKKHIKECTEETICLEKRTADPARDILLTAMKETEDMLEENGLMQPDISDLISEKHPNDKESQEYNKWTIEIIKAAQSKVDASDISRDISSCAKYLNVYNSALEVNKLLRITDIIRYLAEKHKQEGEHKSKLTNMETQLYNNLIGVQRTLKAEITRTENPNVRKLSNTLCTMFANKGTESRAMIFVKTRATCRCLAAYLDQALQKDGIKARAFYGKEDRAGDEGISEALQTDILKRFREGLYNVLVCTAVGSEGIDVPDCNIVLSYEYTGDEITTIQMKGRARQIEAISVTIGSEKILEQERVNAYKALMMSRALDEVCKLEPKQISQKIEPFQKNEIQKFRFRKEASKYISGIKTTGETYEVLCGRCNTFVCDIFDIMKFGTDHIVIDLTLENRINKEEHKKPKAHDGLFKKCKMQCKKCPRYWGIIGTKSRIDCMMLKIKNLKFKNLSTRCAMVYDKWTELPYQFKESKIADLPDILNERNGLTETRSVLLEEITEQKTRKQSDIVTSGRTSDFSSKHLEANVDKNGDTIEESTPTNVETNDATIPAPHESSTGYPLKKSHDDTLSESMLHSIREQMKSVGILIVNARDVGTLFRVGSKYLMTAYHVVKDLIGMVMDNSVYVTFHESPLHPQKKEYHLKEVVFSNQELDVAVLELANPDSTLPPKMQLSKDKIEKLNVRDVSFIGYGHPDSNQTNVKHLDPRCKLIFDQSERVRKAHIWLGQQDIEYLKRCVGKMGYDKGIVDKGYGDYDDDNTFMFDGYMQQGASGSPALAFNKDGQVNVVGVLTHGLPEFYFLLPTLTQHNVPNEYRFEVASKMSSIYCSILNKRRHDLANDLFE